MVLEKRKTNDRRKLKTVLNIKKNIELMIEIREILVSEILNVNVDEISIQIIDHRDGDSIFNDFNIPKDYARKLVNILNSEADRLRKEFIDL